MVEDKHLDGQHAVEEAMSTSHLEFMFQYLSLLVAKALMRNCPKCQKGTQYFIQLYIPSLKRDLQRLSRTVVYVSQCRRDLLSPSVDKSRSVTR